MKYFEKAIDCFLLLLLLTTIITSLIDWESDISCYSMHYKLLNIKIQSITCGNVRSLYLMEHHELLYVKSSPGLCGTR